MTHKQTMRILFAWLLVLLAIIVVLMTGCMTPQKAMIL